MILDVYGNAASVKPKASVWIYYLQIQMRRLVFVGPTSAQRSLFNLRKRRTDPFVSFILHEADRLGWSLECEAGESSYFAQPMPFNELKEFFERESPELHAPADRYGDVPTIATVQ
ncbi:MAG: hypothetical protein H0X08_01505 [Blastocatellia bacterium]|nr:hypothetical protein [Blastocatellia bacterium]